MSLVRLIADIPLFQGLPKEQIDDVTMIVTDQVFKKGEIIFSEGDEATGFYVVVTGRVKIFKLSFDGKEQILHFFGPGEPFGETAVFAGEQFPANAEATENSRTLFFSRESLIALISKTPSIALNMLAILSRRLRRFAALIDDLSLKEVPGRLAAYLLYLSEQHEGSTELQLAVTKGQLASLLGTIPETLSRILGRMTAQGLVISEGPHIRILDLEGLHTLVESGGHL
jgi:CRP/FNR family transcriptional regulator, dissimilatory nitrate respiration regulator